MDSTRPTGSVSTPAGPVTYSLQSHEKITLAQVAATRILLHRKRVSRQARRRIWDEAFAQLKPNETADLGHDSSNERGRPSEVQRKVQERLKESESKGWEYKKANGEKIVLRVVLERVLKWMQRFEAVVDTAVAYDVSGHAALPWTVFKILLNTGFNSVETMGNMIDGVEYTSKVIALYTEVEINSLRGVSRLKSQLGTALVGLYASILRYLSKARRYFGQSSAKRVAKGVFLSSDMIVVPLLDEIKCAEQEVIKVKDLVEAEDQRNRLMGLQSSVDKIIRDGVAPKVSDDDRRYQIKQWLSAILTNDNYQTAQMSRHGDTCNWILSREQFRNWIAPPHDSEPKARFLWIHGGPGFGKTILAAKMIDHLVATQVAPLAYFFCVSENEAKREPYAILRSWIAQLAQKDVHALNAVHEIYKDSSRNSPGPSDLWNLFSDLIKARRYIFVVDGFDECTTINKTSKFHTSDGRLQFLQKLVSECRETQSLFLVVSRDKDDIRTPLTAAKNSAKKSSSVDLLEYCITSEDTRSDVSAFSMAVVKDALANKAEELQSEIAEEAADRAGGMFLWVHLLRQELDSGENAKTLRKIVSEMPNGIDKAYERDLDRLMELKGEKKDRAVAVLRWVLFAVRPLTVRELAEALVLNSASAIGAYPQDELPDAWTKGYVDEDYVNSNIRRCCGSLVELRSHRDNEPLAFHTIHFVHFSVKEYLLRSVDSNPTEPRFQAICFPDGATEHDRLARLCLQYLCYDIFGEKDQWEGKVKRRIRVYPFLEYAAKSWHTHAFRDQRMSEDILHYAEKLFNPATSNWRIWSEVFESEEVLSSDDEEDDDTTNDESDIADEDDDNDDGSLILSDSLSSDIERESDLDRDLLSDSESAEENPGHNSPPNRNDEKISDNPMEAVVQEATNTEADSPSPIYYASLLGLTDIIKALQVLGLHCDTSGGHYGNPLQAAVAYEHQQTAQYLLGQGVDVRRRGGVYGSALGAAVAIGSETMTKILISAGADLRSTDVNGRNLLHASCYNGDINITRLLLASEESNELIKETSKLGDTPLLEAIESGCLPVVQLLVKAGADLNATNKSGTPALILAINGQFEEIVKELIKKKVDITFKWNNGVTALHLAAALGLEKSVRYLLARKADIHAEDSSGWTPLHQAAMADSNQVQIAKLFLDRGATVDESTHDGVTALQLGAELGHEELVAFLLESGADINSVNSSSMSSLYIAVACNRLATVEMLLKHGADPSLTTIEGRTALDQAVRDGRPEIIELLLANGALNDINSTSAASSDAEDVKGLQDLTRMLQVEIFKGNEARVKELLAQHHDEKNRGILNSTLLAATLFGSEAIATLLLKRGASYRSKTANNRTVLHTAAVRGFTPLVEAFLIRGASLHAKDICGSEPLDVAIRGGFQNLATVECLLGRGALTDLISGLENHSLNDDESDRNLEEILSVSDAKRALQGHWKGHYTYTSWQKKRRDPTSMTISFISNNPDSPPTFAGDSRDEVGEFKIRGHLLSGNIVRFVKLYEKNGWLYSGRLHPAKEKIAGSWGTNTSLWHGAFEIVKAHTER